MNESKIIIGLGFMYDELPCTNMSEIEFLQNGNEFAKLRFTCYNNQRNKMLQNESQNKKKC